MKKKQNLKDKILQNWSGNSNVKKQAVIYLVEKCTLYAEHGSRIILTAPKVSNKDFKNNIKQFGSSFQITDLQNTGDSSVIIHYPHKTKETLW